MRTVAPPTRYARADDVHVAYQVFGSGLDLVFVPGFVSHLDNYWDEPDMAAWLRRLGRFARVTMFDKRGTGLSSRVRNLPTMDERMDDVRAVMDHRGIERAAILGVSEGGPLACLFAAHHPERCSALVLYGAFARFTSWFHSEESLEEFFEYVEERWGSGESLPWFAPSRAGEGSLTRWWGKFERLGGDPSAVIELMRMNSEIDVTEILPAIQAPTLVIHRRGDSLVRFEGAETLAELIPDARLVALEGSDHLPFVGDGSNRILEEIEEFLTGTRPPPVGDRVLATVLFTDIVDSTSRAHEMGDRAWGDVMAAHDAAARRQIERFRGRLVKFLGDGVLATFDGPGRSIRCAFELRREMAELDLEIRTGIHTGEVRPTEDDVEGIAVHIASRVASEAGPGEILVSRTVRDLVAGSGISFRDAGVHPLKGVPEEWQLFRAEL